MGMESFPYKFVLLLHLTLVIVGFGSSFVYPMLASKSKGLPWKERYAVDHSVFGVQKYLTSIPIYAAIAAGILLVILSDKVWEFKQTWVSVAFLVSLIAILIATLLHGPNLKAMDGLLEKLADGTAAPGKDGGPPKEVAELEERTSKAAMFGGLLHLCFAVLIIDMIWKPGVGL
jgi:hypothetical protein